MTTQEIKNILHDNIENIEDEKFLEALRIIINSKVEENGVFKLNDIQKKKIRQSNLQFKRGEGISNDEVFEKMEKWLKEK
ncbi:MAG: hypothetical protein M3R36_15440 [Bacteroidota bacterium]|nr:hypothetical protein [Bacteroidota bacterium]